MYKISWYSIFSFMIMGIIFLAFCVEDLKEISTQQIFVFILGVFVGFVFLGYAIYLWRKRIEKGGFYWDDEGVVIDLKGNKVYWHEIEEIKFVKGRSGRSTVIYPHYTYHERIRIRRKKWMPTTGHSIEWFLIEKPKDYHENLMIAWKEKNAKIR